MSPLRRSGRSGLSSASGKGVRGSGTRLRTADLVAALDEFRDVGSAMVEEAGGELALPRWEGAVGMVAALLTGVQQHCPEVQFDADVWARDDFMLALPNERVMVLTLRFEPQKAVGEIATRSHMGADVILESPVRFALLRPPDDVNSCPLALECEGWHFELSPDCRMLRWKMEQEFGKDYQPNQVFEWWSKHKDEIWPLRTSKAHRAMSTIFDQRAFQLTVPNSVKVTTLWSYIHSVSTNIQRLNFMEEGSDGLRVTCVRGKPVAPDTEEDVAKGDEILKETLVRDRQAGEIFAASSFNFLRLIHGHSVGQPGGSVRKLTKLLTAAHRWGPGRSGWQAWDHTWLASDEKDFAGRTVKENGRLVWHMLK